MSFSFSYPPFSRRPHSSVLSAFSSRHGASFHNIASNLLIWIAVPGWRSPFRTNFSFDCPHGERISFQYAVPRAFFHKDESSRIMPPCWKAPFIGLRPLVSFAFGGGIPTLPGFTSNGHLFFPSSVFLHVTAHSFGLGVFRPFTLDQGRIVSSPGPTGDLLLPFSCFFWPCWFLFLVPPPEPHGRPRGAAPPFLDIFSRRPPREFSFQGVYEFRRRHTLPFVPFGQFRALL